MDIYLASSWNNSRYPDILKYLREAGHVVYDWRQNIKGSPTTYTKNMVALRQCDVCILLLPCGRSAHLELGYAVGRGKPTAILHSQNSEQEKSELMYYMVTLETDDPDFVLSWLDRLDRCATPIPAKSPESPYSGKETKDVDTKLRHNPRIQLSDSTD